MADQRLNWSHELSYKQVELLKTEPIGKGSYGTVCKAKCDDLICAAKMLHPTLTSKTLFQIPEQKEYRLPMKRFEQECKFMSAIKHPNIVQYLGTYQDVETGLIALLMELMDDNLTHFLQTCQESLPLYIQVNFCRDIAVALSFLHSNGIIHRDLSSNNVLMIGNSRLKVTDFGMAKLCDMNSQLAQMSVTKCPGTQVYMPPEAIGDNTSYTDKIDCFSFGVLTVQIITRKSPQPGKPYKEVMTKDPQFLDGTVDVRVSEIERRINHIDEISQDHLLRPLALQCLKDKDMDRPSAQEIYLDVLTQKDSPQYVESAENENRSTKEAKFKRDIKQLTMQNEKNEDEIEELTALKTENLNALQEVRSALEAKEKEIQELKHQYIIHDIQDEIKKLEVVLEQAKKSESLMDIVEVALSHFEKQDKRWKLAKNKSRQKLMKKFFS